ncbi:hypothetical protein Poly51_34430 [Rubripirellula tenax]|uniref:Uncharacterized protein n=1 Tax=Rubripirellula tenax TaxID=2528015 RepID=A0A5C6F288_9BACT|nr:hypothetical protein [Rubripirellula tenax]TWU54724.1 hypothetical protein Poly51_34430 [Rubripirellula tenax]
MTVQDQHSPEQLLESAQAGFPGSILSDLVELSDALIARLRHQEEAIQWPIFEVVCQAQNNAVVHAGRTASVARLMRLMKSLEGFESLLAYAIDKHPAGPDLDQTLHEYIGHTEKRKAVVSEMIREAESMTSSDLEPMFVYGPEGSDSTRRAR